MARIEPKRTESQPEGRRGDGRAISRPICCPEGGRRTSNPRQQRNPSRSPSATYMRAIDRALRGTRAVRGQSHEGILNKGRLQVLPGQLDSASVALVQTVCGEDGRRRGVAE